MRKHHGFRNLDAPFPRSLELAVHRLGILVDELVETTRDRKWTYNSIARVLGVTADAVILVWEGSIAEDRARAAFWSIECWGKRREAICISFGIQPD